MGDKDGGGRWGEENVERNTGGGRLGEEDEKEDRAREMKETDGGGR